MSNNPIHIAVIIDSMNGGGAERICLELVEYLLSRSNTVDLLLCELEGELLSEVPIEANLFAVDCRESRRSNSVVSEDRIRWLTPDGLIPWKALISKVIPMWPYWPKKIPRRRYYRVTRTFAITKYFAVCNPQVVIAILPTSYYHIAMAMEIYEVQIPLIASIRNSVAPSGNRSGRHIYKKLLRKSQYVHTISKGLAHEVEALHRVPKDRIVTIQNPACRPEVFELASQPIDHPWVDQKGGRNHKLILGVGRLVKQKNFSMLIDAFAHVISQLPAKLIILGEGGERERLNSQILRLKLSEHIQLPGWTRNPYAYMAQCDVFVLTSNFEGFGNVIVEALQCGANIVSTDCSHGPREILGNGEWGTLVPCRDSDALATAIIDSIHSKRNSKHQIRRAVDFTPENLFSQFECLIQHAIRSTNRK